MHSLCTSYTNYRLLVTTSISPGIRPIHYVFSRRVFRTNSKVCQSSLVVPSVTIVSVSLQTIGPFPSILFRREILPLGSVVLPVLNIANQGHGYHLLGRGVLRFQARESQSRVRETYAYTRRGRYAGRRAQHFWRFARGELLSISTGSLIVFCRELFFYGRGPAVFTRT